MVSGVGYEPTPTFVGMGYNTGIVGRNLIQLSYTTFTQEYKTTGFDSVMAVDTLLFSQ